ncbi:MAG TPA: alpha-glucuronidase family glycosyl hydrolase [Bacteroidota bacterium]
MTRQYLSKFLASIVGVMLCCFVNIASADDGYRLWLKYSKVEDSQALHHYRNAITSLVIDGESETMDIVRNELLTGLRGLLGTEITVVESPKRSGTLIIGTLSHSEIVKRLVDVRELQQLGREGYCIKLVKANGLMSLVIAANEEVGVLYGAFHFLRLIQTYQPLEKFDVTSAPRIQYRLLNHWDNLDGSIERGYAGKSLWKWGELPQTIDPRYRDYARANASLGINGTVVNNVNANPATLTSNHLSKVAALANVFRPYGIKVFLSVNFSSPIKAQFEQEGNRKGGIGDLPTSDPMNPEVRAWWKTKVREIYSLIPDFGGFLVKANSEGMPGPIDYGRTHAEGANMLAEALEPHGGIVIWRAFVYNADIDPDRVKRAYLEFTPLDGAFRPNVFVQPKNGPLDFQPREPVQPLFGAMSKTPMMLELQITQEYLGHSNHLVYLAPMWKEYLLFDTYAKGPRSTLASIIDGTLRNSTMTGIAGVANTGNDRNWCGHFFAQANWFAYGRLAWDHTLSAEQLAEEWITMSLSHDSVVVQTVRAMMMGSREACVNYMTPLGLHHIMEVDVHYGPGPQHDKGREDWTSVYYHRADSVGLGYNRSSTGSNAVGQYFSPLREKYDSINSCPEEYLLWFHHVAWDERLKSGRTLWEELCKRYYAGTDSVRSMHGQWLSMEKVIDAEIFSHVKRKLERQMTDAGIWRDACLQYFQQFSKKPILVSP